MTFGGADSRGAGDGASIIGAVVDGVIPSFAIQSIL